MKAPRLFGIPNCDTVRRARAWLAAQGIEAPLHDFKKAGVPQADLALWLRSVGWERLLNRQGSTWRKLSDAQREAVHDTAGAAALMAAQPSVIKRPVATWPDGTVTVGFDPADWARRLNR